MSKLVGLRIEACILREARDLLLPRLGSGQVDVSEIEVGSIRDV